MAACLHLPTPGRAGHALGPSPRPGGPARGARALRFRVPRCPAVDWRLDFKLAIFAVQSLPDPLPARLMAALRLGFDDPH